MGGEPQPPRGGWWLELLKRLLLTPPQVEDAIEEIDDWSPPRPRREVDDAERRPDERASSGDTDGSSGGIDWKAALLEEAGLRAPGGSSRPPRGPGPGPGLGAGTSEYDGEAPIDWMIDGTYTGGYGEGAIAGRTRLSPLPQGQRLPLKGPQGALARSLRPPGVILPTSLPLDQRQAVIALIHRTQDPLKRHLMERISEEPLFAYAASRWRQARVAGQDNLEIVHAVYERLSRLMGAIYGFEPAMMSYTPQLPQNYISWFDWQSNRFFIQQKYLGGTFADTIEGLAHCQAHSLQRHLIGAYRAGELTGELAMLGEWLANEHQLRPGAGCDTLIRGYHASDLSLSVGHLVKHLPDPRA